MCDLLGCYAGEDAKDSSAYTEPPNYDSISTDENLLAAASPNPSVAGLIKFAIYWAIPNFIHSWMVNASKLIYLVSYPRCCKIILAKLHSISLEG
ncbi:MAG: hypothetical protein V4485_01450 [Pseudomonadota bacterium]